MRNSPKRGTANGEDLIFSPFSRGVASVIRNKIQEHNRTSYKLVSIPLSSDSRADKIGNRLRGKPKEARNLEGGEGGNLLSQGKLKISNGPSTNSE